MMGGTVMNVTGICFGIIMITIVCKTIFCKKLADMEALDDYFVMHNIKFCYFITLRPKQEKTINAEKSADFPTVLSKSVNIVLSTSSVALLNNLQKSFIRHHTSSKLTVTVKNKNKYDIDCYLESSQTIFNTTMGSWTTQTRLTMFNKERRNLTDIMLRVVREETSSTSAAQTKAINNFHYELLLLLQELHNFSLFIKTEKRNTVQMLRNNEADVVTGLLMLDLDPGVHFLMSFYEHSSFFFIRVPKPSRIAFLRPLSRHTWYALISCSIIISVVFKIALSASQAEEATWAVSVMTVFYTLCQDGDDPSPTHRDLGCKITFLTLLVFSLLLFNYYTSSMVSLLLSPESAADYPIDDLTEIAIDNQSYITRWLSSATGADINRLNNKKIVQSNSAVGLGELFRGRSAYYTDILTAYGTIGQFFDQEEICDLVQIKMIPTNVAGFALRKNSPFLESFQISLQKLNELGLIGRLKKRLKIPEPKCYTQEVASVGLKQALAAFVCLCVGIIASAGTLIFELGWVLLKKR